jgi:hypothetical protein
MESEMLGVIGAFVSNRIYPLRLPEGVTLPAVAWEVVSNFPEADHSGDAGLEMARLRYKVFGSNYASAKTVADSIRGLNGTTGTTVKSIFVDNKFTLIDPPTGLPFIVVDLVVWGKEN